MNSVDLIIPDLVRAAQNSGCYCTCGLDNLQTGQGRYTALIVKLGLTPKIGNTANKRFTRVVIITNPSNTDVLRASKAERERGKK